MNGFIRHLVPDRGYGFIQGDDKGSRFFHRSAVEGVDFDSLRVGQPVRFDDHVDIRSGRSCAINVSLTI